MADHEPPGLRPEGGLRGVLGGRVAAFAGDFPLGGGIGRLVVHQVRAPLPTKKEVVTIIRAVHKYKDSREQFEMRTHKRLIDILSPTPKTADALSRLDLPAGVDITLKVMK